MAVLRPAAAWLWAARAEALPSVVELRSGRASPWVVESVPAQGSKSAEAWARVAALARSPVSPVAPVSPAVRVLTLVEAWARPG